MLPELPKAVVDWAQVVGAGLGLVAIIVALFALWRQRHDMIRERRVLHDLETLREIARRAAEQDCTFGELMVLWRRMSNTSLYVEDEFASDPGEDLENRLRYIRAKVAIDIFNLAKYGR